MSFAKLPTLRPSHDLYTNQPVLWDNADNVFTHYGVVTPYGAYNNWVNIGSGNGLLPGSTERSHSRPRAYIHARIQVGKTPLFFADSERKNTFQRKSLILRSNKTPLFKQNASFVSLYLIKCPFCESENTCMYIIFFTKPAGKIRDGMITISDLTFWDWDKIVVFWLDITQVCFKGAS